MSSVDLWEEAHRRTLDEVAPRRAAAVHRRRTEVPAAPLAAAPRKTKRGDHLRR